MADILLPTWLKCAKVGFRYADSTGVSQPEFSGIIRTGSRGGDRLRAELEFTPTATSSTEAAQERRALMAFLARLQGRQNRAYLTNPARRIGGSFPTTELFTNNTFANGTTGWSTQNSTLSVHDRVMRLTVSKASGAGPAFYQSPTVSQYVPYILRGFLGQRSKTGVQAGTYTNGVSNYSLDAQGLISQVMFSISTSLGTTYPVVYDGPGNVTVTGDYIDCPYTSLARCALVDNGPNLLLQSDDFTTTWTNTRSTDAANSTTAPDGTSTADSIIEDATASSTHYVQQNVTVASTTNLDYAFTVCLKAGTRSFARVELLEGTGSHECYIDVNLTSGALGTATASGANWTNPRAFVVDLKNGWWKVTIIGRKASASTTVGALVLLATSLGGTSYSGDGASLIYAWRATLAQSGVPTRLVQTTTAATTGTAQTGNRIHLKGLPVSTNGLLLPGDEVEVITSYGSELKLVTASLNSDAAGLGYLQFNPPLRGAPADNAAVVIHEPMGRFVFTGDIVGWEHEPGIVTRASAEFEESA